MNNEIGDSGVPPEYKVFKAFNDWFDQGKKLVDLFRQHDLTLPPTLRLLTGDKKHEANHKSLVVLPPEKPESPGGVQSDWRWIKAADASAQTLVLAILNEGKPVPPVEIAKRIADLNPDVSTGGVYNVGPRLDGKKIHRTKQGWVLIADKPAPTLYKGYIWGPPEVLAPQDLATFRRMAIVHLLGGCPDGLKIVEIYKMLKSVDWLGKPMSKDLIKDDMDVLEKKDIVRQMGVSKKWNLVQEDQISQ
ncbi:MAG: hypothetical protein PHF00_05925 [Elusimicrobia bacterium]|nr:hypothetical protein [Elusimicrobiota bacterium]